MKHNSDSTNDEADSTWSDATWLIGPTLNSDRCTAYFDETPAADGAAETLYPMPTSRLEYSSASSWMAFDVVGHSWEKAPGHHCPSFSIEPLVDTKENMQHYINAAIQDQENIVRKFKQKISVSEGTSEGRDGDLSSPDKCKKRRGESFIEMVKRNMEELMDEDGCISRKEFLAWKSVFYADELDDVKNRLRRAILSKRSGVKFPSGNDQDDNSDFVESMLDDFTRSFEAKQAARRLARRSFLASVNRPVLSRAFFSWKFACRSKTAGSSTSMASSGMFAEPELPWNVRHPR